MTEKPDSMRTYPFYFWFLEINFLSCLVVQASVYLNQWAVEIHEGSVIADQIAEKNGFKNLGQIGSLENYYLFEHKKVRKRSVGKAKDKFFILKDEPEILWCQQQKAKRRVKRDLLKKISFSDPLWTKMWYLNREGDNMNVMEAWSRGYTGKGVVVTILDDGIEYNHTDLSRNFDPYASYDVIGDDNDPMPRYDTQNANNHGTRCAGEVAATANNRKCMVGVAFNARIGGVRMLDGDTTDAIEARAFNFNTSYVDIYSSSWGPEDNGQVVDGPDRLAKEAFLLGVTKGRQGKGSIYIWASGNGGSLSDSCSCDGYASSIHTLSVGGTTENGKKPWYLEECSSTMATTYSSGDEHKERKIMTTDLHNSCGEHTGTSSSAAMAAGMCALALEANPSLTWRDMQYIVMLTARTKPLKEASWVKNGAGRLVSHRYGYGLMDGLAMTELAERWITVPEQHSCSTPYQSLDTNFTDLLELEIAASGCRNSTNEINYLEHTQATVWLTSSIRGSLEISLTSPNGTTSILLPRRRKDSMPGQFKNWTFMSVFYWGENPEGKWKLKIKNVGKSEHSGNFYGWQLIFHGTEAYPINITEPVQPNISKNSFIDNHSIDLDLIFPKISESEENVLLNQTSVNSSSLEDVASEGCHSECLNDSCIGPSRFNCTGCKNFMVATNGGCVTSCPNNTYANPSNVCLSCPSSCYDCMLEADDITIKCLSCEAPYFLHFAGNDTQCIPSCQDGFYEDYVSRRCIPCAENCLKCQDENTCSECQEGFEISENQCFVPCSKSEFRSRYDGSCSPCDESCQTCSGPGNRNCVTCAVGSLWEDILCVLNCSDGYYSDQYNMNFPLCQLCHTSCKTCYGQNDTECYSCHKPFKLLNQTCTAECPFDFYEVENTCMKCPQECSRCSSEVKCSECRHPRVLYNGKCLEKCPENTTYIDTDLFTGRSTRKCHPCHSSCKSCSGTSKMSCTSCKEELYFAFGQCVRECKTHEFKSERKCLKCHSDCLTCDGPSENQCLDCSPDFYFVQNKCLSFCPSGFYVNSSRCLSCAEECSTCDNPDSCLSCTDGSHPTDGVCRLVEKGRACTKNYYFDELLQTCEKCHESCEGCSGPGNNDCLSCKILFVSDQSVCYPCCSDSVSGTCCACDLSMDTCKEVVQNEIETHGISLDEDFGFGFLPDIVNVSSTSSFIVTEKYDVTTHSSLSSASNFTTTSKPLELPGTAAEDSTVSVNATSGPVITVTTTEISTSTATEVSTSTATEFNTSTAIEVSTGTTTKVSTTGGVTVAPDNVSFFSIVLSVCLGLIVLLAFSFIIAFGLFQARANNKLCWYKQRYQFVPMTGQPSTEDKQLYINGVNITRGKTPSPAFV